MGLHLVLGGFVGAPIGFLAQRYLLDARRRLAVPLGVWWLLVFAGIGVAVVSAVNSTMPSLAPRTVIEGRADFCARVETGRGRRALTKFVIRFQPETAGKGGPIELESSFNAPMCWRSNRGNDSQRYRVTYLADNHRALDNEVVQIEVLSGQDTGWRDGVDARLFGVWLGIPAGFGLGYMALFATNSRRSDLKLLRREAISERRAGILGPGV
jgi:hypothetical protein